MIDDLVDARPGRSADASRPAISRVSVVIARTASCRSSSGLAAHDALVDGQPGELQRAGRLDRRRDGLGLGDRPDPGPPADHADVDQDRQPPPSTGQPGRHPLDAGHRIGEDQQLRSVPVEDVADPVEAGVVDDLVGDQDPLDARVERHLAPATDARP